MPEKMRRKLPSSTLLRPSILGLPLYIRARYMARAKTSDKAKSNLTNAGISSSGADELSTAPILLG